MLCRKQLQHYIHTCITKKEKIAAAIPVLEYEAKDQLLTVNRNQEMPENENENDLLGNHYF